MELITGIIDEMTPPMRSGPKSPNVQLDKVITPPALYRFRVLGEGRPMPQPGQPQHLCLDKGYDFPQVRELVARYGSTAHIRSRGEERVEKQTLPGYRARRWVVERRHPDVSGNRFRRLLIRWEKRQGDYLAMLHFACAWITFRASRLFG